MAIVAESASSTNVFGDTLTITKPSGTVSGDVLVAVVGNQAGDDAITGPSGWTEVQQARAAENSIIWRHSVWYLVAGGSEPADYGWSSISTHWGGGIVRFSGVDNGTVEDATATNNSGASTSPTGTGLTTVTDGAMLVYCPTWRDAAAVLTPPTGMTEQYEVNSRIGVSEATEEIATAQATGSRTGTLDASQSWYVTMMALKPAGAAAERLPEMVRPVMQPRPIRQLRI